MTLSSSLHLPDAPLRQRETYGTMMRQGNWWILDLQPNAMMMFKRVFTRIEKTARDEIRLRRSSETDRLLQWFADLYPLEMTGADVAALHRSAEEYRETARTVGKLLSGEYQPRAFKMALPPRDYQRVAAEMWLRVKRLLLADDLGTGKTISAITGLSDPATRPAAIVCQTNLPHQWREQILRCLPSARVHLLQGTTPYDVPAATAKEERRGGKPPGSGWPDFVILNYHRLDGWASTVGPRVRAVVFDEVQELRHVGTKRYTAAKAITSSAPYVLGMSATPMHNFGGEMFSVVDVLAPGALGEREEFNREWTSGEEERKRKIVDPRAFGLHLREAGLMLRRTRRDVNRELPALTVVPHHIAADLGALTAIGGNAALLARTILDQRMGAGAGLAKMKASGEFERVLRQATGIAKAPFVADFVRMVVEGGERVILAGWHREFWRIVMDRLKDLAPALYSGSESERQKRAALERFKSGATPVLCLSLRSGTGIDGLQYVCRTVVIGEMDWSPVVHDQLIGRAHRDGQPDPVTAYFLISDEGSDPVVSDVCGAKRANTEPIRNPDAQVTTVRVDPAHIRKLAEAYLSRRR